MLTRASAVPLALSILVGIAMACSSTNTSDPSGGTSGATSGGTSGATSGGTGATTSVGTSGGTSDSGSSGKPSSALLDPSLAKEEAPATYKARFTTTKGDFVVSAERALAPNGADRFFNLVKIGYYDGTRFFRVVDGFMVQWGIHGDPAVSKVWRAASITDDSVKGSNARGQITFATAGPNTRTTQVFINFVNNASLDSSGFATFGKITEGMDVVDKLHKEYGEGPPNGTGPNQSLIQSQGNAYLDKDFPKLDSIVRAVIE